MLLLTEVDSIPQKRGYKRNLVWLDSSAGGKMVLTLLAEVVALYVQPTAINILSFDLEFVSRSTLGDLEERLDDFIPILLTILISTRILVR